MTKKFNFHINKKIIIYLSIININFLVGTFIFPALNGTFLNQTLGAIAIALAVFIVSSKNIYESYEMDNACIICKGLFGKIIKYNKITRIDRCENWIIIYTSQIGRSKKLKLNINMLETNIDNARLFLKEIVDVSGEKLTFINKEIQDFIDCKKDSLISENQNIFNTTSKYVLVISCVFILLNIEQNVKSMIVSALLGFDLISIIKGVIYLAIMLVGIYVFILLTSKTKRNKAFIKKTLIYYLIGYSLIIILNLFFLYDMSNAIKLMKIVDNGLFVITLLFLILIIREYFDKSKSAETTFEN